MFFGQDVIFSATCYTINLPAVYVYICTYIYTPAEKPWGLTCNCRCPYTQCMNNACRKILILVLRKTPRQPNGWPSVYTRARHTCTFFPEWWCQSSAHQSSTLVFHSNRDNAHTHTHTHRLQPSLFIKRWRSVQCDHSQFNIQLYWFSCRGEWGVRRAAKNLPFSLLFV